MTNDNPTQSERKKAKVEARLPIAPAMKCAQWPLRLGWECSIHFFVDSMTPKYVAPVARDPVIPGATPL